MKNNSKSTITNKFPPPFFIVGSPRSGTTLVAQILDSHSRIAVYLETNYYLLFRPDLRLYGDLRQPANLKRLMIHVLDTIRIQGVTPPELEEFQRMLVAPTFEGVLTTLLQLYAQQQGKVRSADKTPMHYKYLPEILENFPQSPVIFLMRDPRDTIASMRRAFSVSLEQAIHTWSEAYVSYTQVSRPVHLVRYEELVHEPFEIVKAMCAFLNEAYEPAMFRFFERIPEHLQAIPHLDLSKLSGPVVTTSIGNFKKMPSEDIEQIESACGAGMEALGYRFTTSPTKTVLPIASPKRVNPLRFLFDRLRYYRLNTERWRRGWFRWKMMLQLRAHYLLRLGPLRNGK